MTPPRARFGTRTSFSTWRPVHRAQALDRERHLRHVVVLWARDDEAALAHATEREQFGRPLASFRLVQYRLAGMPAEVTSLQALTVGREITGQAAFT